MAEIRLHVTRERLDALNVGERIAFEEPGEASTRLLRDMIARFSVGDDGKYLTVRAARRLLNRLSTDELIEVARRVYEQVDSIAINPTPAADSPTPSAV